MGCILEFKYKKDLTMWRNGFGPEHVRKWITLANAISASMFDVACVVTSWFRNDDTFHRNGYAFDLRTRVFKDDDDVEYFIRTLVHVHGIPAVWLNKGTPNSHIHVGDLATLKFHKEKEG